MDHKENMSVFGIRPLMEAVDSGKIPDKIFIQRGLRGEAAAELMHMLKEHSLAYSLVPQEKLDRLTRENHQGVFAFLSPVEFASVEGVVEEVIGRGGMPWVLILDHLTDVRNFGAIVRTAECAGVDAVVVAAQGAAPVSAEAVKASAGAMFRVPICKSANLTDTAYYLKQCGLRLVCATEKTDAMVYSADLTGPLALVMGNEEKGISKQLLRLADLRVKLPMAGQIGSLNVSAACTRRFVSGGYKENSSWPGGSAGSEKTIVVSLDRVLRGLASVCEEMFHEDFYSDAHQDDASGESGPAVEPQSETQTHADAREGRGKCYGKDDDGGQHDPDVEKGKRDAYGQGVDAGGQGNAQGGAGAPGVGRVSFRGFRTGTGVFERAAFPQAFPDHFPTEKSQQGEGDPVVEAFDQAFEMFSGDPSDNRHGGLKGGQCQGDLQGAGHREAFHGYSARYRGGKTVH